MTAYFIELRRSPVRWWLGPLIVIDLIVLFGRARYWIGVWPETSVTAQIPAFYLAPVFAAVAAYVTGRPSRKSFDSDNMPQARAQWASDTSKFLATLTFGLFPYLVGVLVAAMVSRQSAGSGRLVIGYVFLGIALITGAASIGHLVGRLFPSSMVAPMVCGIGGFLVISVSPRSFGLYVLDGYPNFEPSNKAVAARMAVAAVLSVIAVAIPSTFRNRFTPGREAVTLRRSTIVVVALTVFAGSVVSVAQAGPVQIARQPATTMLCTRGNHVFCIWPEHQKYFETLTAMTQRFDAIPAELFPATSKSFELGLQGSSHLLENFRLLEGQPWQAASFAAGTAVLKSFDKWCAATTNELQNKMFQAFWELSTWLAVRINGSGRPSALRGGPAVDMNEIVQLTTSSKEVQIDWVNARKIIVNDTPCAS